MREHLRHLRESFGRHGAGVYASAIAFHLLAALVPLSLLAVAVLGALGLEDVWTDDVAPAFEDRLSRPVFGAIDFSVQEIFRASIAPVFAFSALLLFWYLTRAVGSAMAALNRIHDVEDTRPFARRTAVAAGLAVAAGGCAILALLVVTVVPRLVDGWWHWPLLLASLAVAALLLAVAVGLLLRYAPAEHPEPRWASAGSALIVGGWLAESLVFGWWTTSVASYKSAIGNLAVFLVLTAYVIVASSIFLLGAELDEYARSTARGSRSATRGRGSRRSRASRRRR